MERSRAASKPGISPIHRVVEEAAFEATFQAGISQAGISPSSCIGQSHFGSAQQHVVVQDKRPKSSRRSPSASPLSQASPTAPVRESKPAAGTTTERAAAAAAVLFERESTRGPAPPQRPSPSEVCILAEEEGRGAVEPPPSTPTTLAPSTLEPSPPVEVVEVVMVPF